MQCTKRVEGSGHTLTVTRATKRKEGPMSAGGTLFDDQQETTEDFVGDEAPRFEASLTSADWTIGTIIDQLERGTIDLNPSFQRRDAWRIQRKSEFIESIIMNVPVPQIVLAEKKRGSFIVIDGKQRLLTIKQFAGLDLNNPQYNYFRLKGLRVRCDLNGKSYKDFENDIEIEDERNAFENYTIRSVVIRNWPDENFLYVVFHRLNTGSVALSPQELRQALHPGPFSTYVDEFSINSEAIRKVIGNNKPDFRMRDAELVIRFFAFNNFFTHYVGNLKPLLDLTTKHFNDYWHEKEDFIKEQSDMLETSIEATIEIFGDGQSFRKWNGSSYENAINRAVFDVMVLYFCDVEISSIAIDKRLHVKEAFERLCETNERFRDAIEGTTKSIESIRTRMSAWGDALVDAGLPREMISNRLSQLSMA